LLTDESKGLDSNSDCSFWQMLANKANQGAFDKKPVFKGLCQIMLQVSEASEANKGKQDLRYSTEFTNFLVVLRSISPKSLELFRQNLEGQSLRNIRYIFFISYCIYLKYLLILIYALFRYLQNNSKEKLVDPNMCYENVARFKRLLDTLKYDGLIVAMTDNTKLKPGLQYSAQFGCIIGSSLQLEETQVNNYDDIPIIINNIKEKKAIAKDVRAYLLQVKYLLHLFLINYIINIRLKIVILDSTFKDSSSDNCFNFTYRF